MTKVYFVRHAQSLFKRHVQDDFSAREDLHRPLSEKGLRDRALVSGYLADKGISAVLSSPCKRARDTVAPLAEMLNLPVQIVDSFAERRVADDWIEDFDAYAQRQWADFSYALPGGESLGETQARNIAALQKALAEHAGQNIAIGSHGTALSTVIRYYDAGYGYADFAKIQGLMPWIVRFTFEGDTFLGYESLDVFSL